MSNYDGQTTQLSLTLPDPHRTRSLEEGSRLPATHELVVRYQEILAEQRRSWTAHHHLGRVLGQGGQGVVYLSERRGADGFTLPIAVKIFSPERFQSLSEYDTTMLRIARVAALVAQIQQDNLLDVHDFADRNRVRMMFMEWIDGFDLSRLAANHLLTTVRARVSAKRWEYINRVIVTQGPVHARMKPGVAVAVVRDCLAALAALHRQGIVHGDIKPANIMLKRTGNVKIVDIGSAFEIADPPTQRTCTPRYAAPEILDGAPCTPGSDLASLGYVLVELLSGRPVFAGPENWKDLLHAKRTFLQKLPSLLPAEVACSELLVAFCRRLVNPDPTLRFPNAEAADLVQEGAAAFPRPLVKGDLSSEYDSEIRMWLQELHEIEEQRWQPPGGPAQ